MARPPKAAATPKAAPAKPIFGGTKPKGNPTEIINGIKTNINAILVNMNGTAKMDDASKQVFYTNQKALLKTQVSMWIVTTRDALFENAKGVTNFFKGDVDGILTGSTDYEGLTDTYVYATLVNVLAKELIAEMQQSELDVHPDLAISSVEVAKAIAAGTDTADTHVMTLTDGATLEVEKATGNVAATNPTTGKVTILQGAIQVGKNWGRALLNWLITMFETIRNVVGNFISGKPKEATA